MLFNLTSGSHSRGRSGFSTSPLPRPLTLSTAPRASVSAAVRPHVAKSTSATRRFRLTTQARTRT
jgi:hypothetical protein